MKIDDYCLDVVCYVSLVSVLCYYLTFLDGSYQYKLFYYFFNFRVLEAVEPCIYMLIEKLETVSLDNRIAGFCWVLVLIVTLL